MNTSIMYWWTTRLSLCNLNAFIAQFYPRLKISMCDITPHHPVAVEIVGYHAYGVVY